MPAKKYPDISPELREWIEATPMTDDSSNRSEPTKERTLDGKPIHIDTLCRHEPAWAANRIRENEKTIRDLVALLRDHALGYLDEWEVRRDDLIEQHEEKRGEGG